MTVPIISQIPAPRATLIDERTGEISREWYMFLFRLYESTSIGSDFLSHVVIPTGDFSPDNSTWHIMCSGDITISLPSYLNRDRVLTITNTGTGVITVLPISGEVIKSESSITLDFQWTTIQLCPKLGGYVII